MQLCKLNDAVNHGTVVQLFLEPVESGDKSPLIITGDHRPMCHFLADWDAAGRPLVRVADDHGSLELDN